MRIKRMASMFFKTIIMTFLDLSRFLAQLPLIYLKTCPITPVHKSKQAHHFAIQHFCGQSYY